VAHQVHQVGRVLPVVDGERRIEADAAGVLAQQARADAVEGAGPGQRGRGRERAGPGSPRQDALDAARHLAGRAAREGQQQDAAGIGALATSCATRCASVLVLPDPAPAITSRLLGAGRCRTWQRRAAPD
jgi:hypothetical protein